MEGLDGLESLACGLADQEELEMPAGLGFSTLQLRILYNLQIFLRFISLNCKLTILRSYMVRLGWKVEVHSRSMHHCHYVQCWGGTKERDICMHRIQTEES